MGQIHKKEASAEQYRLAPPAILHVSPRDVTRGPGPGPRVMVRSPGQCCTSRIGARNILIYIYIYIHIYICILYTELHTYIYGILVYVDIDHV